MNQEALSTQEKISQSTEMVTVDLVHMPQWVRSGIYNFTNYYSSDENHPYFSIPQQIGSYNFIEGVAQRKKTAVDKLSFYQAEDFFVELQKEHLKEIITMYKDYNRMLQADANQGETELVHTKQLDSIDKEEAQANPEVSENMNCLLPANMANNTSRLIDDISPQERNGEAYKACFSCFFGPFGTEKGTQSQVLGVQVEKDQPTISNEGCGIYKESFIISEQGLKALEDVDAFIESLKPQVEP